MGELLKQVARHRFSMDGDVAPDWDQRFLADMWEVYPEAVAKEPVNGTKPRRGATVLAARAFLKVFKAHRKNGSVMVSETEVSQRVETCRLCSERSNLSGCAKCRQLIAEYMVGAPRKYDWGKRPFCGICSCSLDHKVWLPGIVLMADDRDLTFPDHCWVPRSESTTAAALPEPP